MGKRASKVKLLIGVGAALLLAAAATAEAAEKRHDFRIELDGTFSEFVMYCTLVDGDRRQTIRRREYLPESYRILADAVSCTVTMLDFRGRISGSLYADGELVASSAQNAIRPVIMLRSAGPWGTAGGARSAIPITPSVPRKPPPAPKPRPGAPSTLPNPMRPPTEVPR
jgi:hypothetical protein